MATGHCGILHVQVDSHVVLNGRYYGRNKLQKYEERKVCREDKMNPFRLWQVLLRVLQALLQVVHGAFHRLRMAAGMDANTSRFQKRVRVNRDGLLTVSCVHILHHLLLCQGLGVVVFVVPNEIHSWGLVVLIIHNEHIVQATPAVLNSILLGGVVFILVVVLPVNFLLGGRCSLRLWNVVNVGRHPAIRVYRLIGLLVLSWSTLKAHGTTQHQVFLVWWQIVRTLSRTPLPHGDLLRQCITRLNEFFWGQCPLLLKRTHGGWTLKLIENLLVVFVDGTLGAHVAAHFFLLLEGSGVQ
mmetsp:Transcript_22475/g.26025  ORF Transcript_22475/g.26025 Transcript_22475/m.26025 type:complete len:298 (+) Transcript_22475:259-1152(+)